MHLLNNSPELFAATIVAAFTGLMWIPIIANRLLEMGPWKALKNPQPDVRPHSDWAYRLACAHRNAIENLCVFAPLAVAVHLMNAGNSATAAAAWVFVSARIAHAGIYTLGIPLLRTVAFFAGFGCQMTLFARLLA